MAYLNHINIEVLPAHAGMIPVTGAGSVSLGGAPRTRGDDPVKGKLQIPYYECSPHTRG